MGSTNLPRTQLVDVSLKGIVTDKLGTATGTTVGTMTDVEVGKAVKMSGISYIAATIGDEIQGIISSVEPGVKDGGYSWGGVQRTGRADAVVDAAQTPVLAIGDIVCSGTAVANATAGNVTVISAGTGFSAPSDFKWRCIGLGSVGTGAVGTTVLIEKI